MKYIFSLLFFFLVPLQIFAADASSREYLRKQGIDAWVIMARSAIGDALALADVGSLPTDTLMNLAKTSLAFTASGGDPASSFGKKFIDMLKRYAYSGQLGDSTLLNDDIWGILALRSLGVAVDDSVIRGSSSFILKYQQSDGGWGWGTGSGVVSDTNDTAAAIMALIEAGFSPSDPSLQRARAYLAAQQNDSGGFSYDFNKYANSDAASEAWVVSALTKMGENPNAWKKNGVSVVDHLRSFQLSDGSYAWRKGDASGTPAITAWAVIALEGMSYPVRRSNFATSVSQPTPQPLVAQTPQSSLMWNTPLPGAIATSVSSQKTSEQAITAPPVFPSITRDSDGDGYTDAEELSRGYDPHDPAPCARATYSTKLKNPYGGMRFAHAENEACRARYVRRELEKMLFGRLRISSRTFLTLLNAYLYGGYDLKDLAMAAKGAKTVHPTIYKDVWVRRGR